LPRSNVGQGEHHGSAAETAVLAVDMGAGMFRLGCLFVLLSLSPAFAADEKIEKPVTGFVYDSKENSALRFQCSDTGPIEVRCEFSQISVSKTAKDNELGKTLEQARQQFRADPLSRKDMNEMCSYFENLSALLHGSSSKLEPDEITAYQKMSAQERQFFEKLSGLNAVFCKNPTEENYLNVIRLTHERDTKTCLIKTSKFTRTFKWITENTWASSVGPNDEQYIYPASCGIVIISRLNQVTAGNYKEWVYTTKKVVSNKNSNSCKEVDENEHVYDWHAYGSHFVGCDYIEMGPTSFQ